MFEHLWAVFKNCSGRKWTDAKTGGDGNKVYDVYGGITPLMRASRRAPGIHYVPTRSRILRLDEDSV